MKINDIEEFITSLTKENESLKCVVFDPNLNLSLNNLENTFHFISEKDFSLYISNQLLIDNSLKKIVFTIDCLKDCSKQTNEAIKKLIQNCRKYNIAIVNLGTI